MRIYTVVLWWISSICIGHAFGIELNERALGIADIPPCGLTCLLQTVPAAGCSLTDTQCQCNNVELTYSTAACILANCTMADSLGTAKVQADLCNLPHESRTGILFSSITAVYAIVCLFVALRFATRVITKRIRIDDWLILAALVLTTATYTSAYEMTRYNFGKHLWDLQSGQLQIALKYFYVCWNLYVITLGLVKASLIAFYLQVFHERRFRIACWIVLGFIALTTIIIQFLTIFACTPIESFWDRDIKGKCLDVGAIGFANSALAITQDIIILIMPMPSLFKLQLKPWRKVAVTLMFAVGAFGCITTIIRLRALAGFKISLDPTWDYVTVIIWTGAELAAGIICASLPAVRQLLTIILPSRFQRFLTNRSRSRSRSGGQTPSLQRQRKVRSPFPFSGPSSKNSYGVTTDISTSTGLKSQAETVQDIERGRISTEQQQKPPTWNPLRTLFPKQSRSLQTSFWASVDRETAPSPPLNDVSTTRRPHITGFHAMASRTAEADTTGRGSVDERLELLQIPNQTYQPRMHRREDEGITALPRIGVLPDRSYTYESGNRAGWI